MKRTAGALFLVLTLLLSIAGCGGQSTNTKPVDSSQPAAAAPAPEVKKEEVPPSGTIDVLSWWEVKPDSQLDKLKAAFETKYPTIKVNYILSPAKGYYEKLLVQIGGGQVPDVAMLAQDQFMPFAEKGALVSLDKYLAAAYKSDLYPAVLKTITHNGSVYAVPRDTTANALFYNKAMFDEANVAYPNENWTWDDFLAASRKLTKTDASGKPIQWGFHYATYPDGIYDFILQAGGLYVSEDGKQSMLGSPETRAALQWLYDLRYTHKVAPSPAQAKEFGGSSASPFTAGKVAMYVGGASRAGSFTKAKLNYDVAPLPKGKKQASRIFTNLWVMPKGAKNEAAAAKFLEFMGGPEGQALAQQLNMGQAALKSVNTATFLTPPPDSKKYFVEAFKYGEPFPSFSNSSEFFALMERELDLFWNGQRSLDESLAAIEKEANGILNQK